MKYKIIKPIGLFLLLVLYFTLNAQAQDTLHATLPEMEKQFIERNLGLLSEKYNIDIAKAQAIQAKLYNNPNLSFTGAIYNTQEKKLFDISDKAGEYIVGLQQLVRLAGKRNKEIQLAETTIRLSENRFFDLLRTLRFSLRSNFYQLYFLQNSINAYAVQITNLEKLNTIYQDLLGKGTVTLKDAARIKSFLYTLKAEQAALQNQANDVNAELQLLIQNNSVYIAPIADSLIFSFNVGHYSLPSLVDSALTNRFDLKISEANILSSQQNYALQKALAVPDISIGAQFDKRGSFVENASFFTVAIDLPFFNQNQGNIKAAKLGIDQAKTLLLRQQTIVENEVQKAYTKALNTDKMIRSFDAGFKNELLKLLFGITENFQKRNISLLELTDFYASYKANIIQLNQLQNERVQAIETLQFVVGKPIF